MRDLTLTADQGVSSEGYSSVTLNVGRACPRAANLRSGKSATPVACAPLSRIVSHYSTGTRCATLALMPASRAFGEQAAQHLGQIRRRP